MASSATVSIAGGLGPRDGVGSGQGTTRTATGGSERLDDTCIAPAAWGKGAVSGALSFLQGTPAATVEGRLPGFGIGPRAGGLSADAARRAARRPRRR